MKIRIYLATLLVFAFSFSAFAQSPEQRQQILAKYDLQKLDRLADEAAVDFFERQMEAIELSKVYGWPESYETENGGQGLLIGTIDGEIPLYLETTNRNAGITARVDRINSGGSAGLDLNGEGMLIGVWDGARVRETHQLLENRATHIDGATNVSNHSTHVTGTIIGSGAFQGGNAKGAAPAAEVISSDFNNIFSELIAAIANTGILLSNHSYGIPADGGPNNDPVPVWYLGKYTQESRNLDVIHFNSPYHLAVYSAGNARNTGHLNQADGGYDILTAHSTSKNTLVVAATNQVLNYVNASSVVMSSFSSWGPTDDGRIKPDISAKGVGTFSSIGTSDNTYATFSGTSMSAPSVTGALALLQQHYSNLNAGEFMRASTLRGLVIHTADEAGAHPGPDYRFGWGLINAERAAEVISDNPSLNTIRELTLTDGNFIRYSGTAIPGERLVVSITWTDPPGAVNNSIEDDDNPRLINDLDIRVSDSNGNTFFPWILDHTNFAAPATTGHNFRDNVEKIEIDVPAGEYDVTVTHQNSLVNGEQAFSLIITGLEDTVLSTTSNEIVTASIYPNPATNVLNVNAISQISEVEISNLLGQSMGIQKVKSNNAQIDISSLSAGTYFVRVTIDNASSVYKFIKK